MIVPTLNREKQRGGVGESDAGKKVSLQLGRQTYIS
jgi:hypothetical protein